jgi:O-acetyl-ADP-ribose deacetylase (regulator of RNase III)
VRPITFITGDATDPTRTAAERVLIAHVVNDEGKWGRGFVVALSKRDPRPEQDYRLWHATAALGRISILGRVQAVPYSPLGARTSSFNTWVANMCAQRGWRRGDGDGDPQALDEHALRMCLRDVARWVSEGRYSRVVMPRIGAGLGGARWSTVRAIIEEELCERDVDVTVYSLPGTTWGDNDE